jgi:hypothetical protein
LAMYTLRNPMLIVHKDGRKIKNAIKDYRSYIYQFRCTRSALFEILEIVYGTPALLESFG